MSVDQILQQVKDSPWYKGQIEHVENISAEKPPRVSPLDDLHPEVVQGLRGIGVEELWQHQADAIRRAMDGENVVVATGTASGKSVAYMAPIFHSILEDGSSTALYISPLNALVNDQLKSFKDLHGGFTFGVGADIKIDKYTGDVPKSRRRRIRDSHPNILLTNPEMVHLTFTGWSHLWAGFLRNLKYVVIDESHYYRGVVGSHMANLVRRLRRVCQHYDADPQFILCSATIGNPGEHARQLVGKPFTVIDSDGSHSGHRRVVLWNPPVLLNNGRGSSHRDSAQLFSNLVEEGLQTILFTRSRQGVERLYRAAHRELRKQRSDKRIASYRGGYLGDERREVEEGLKQGDLAGVISTNALELGIDVGGLDACVINRFPGSITSMRQQAGRAGRGTDDSLVVLVAGVDALDQYYMRNPHELLGAASEQAIIDPENKYIHRAHIKCAAAEHPLTRDDERFFGEGFWAQVESLVAKGELEVGPQGVTVEGYPHGDVSIRSIGDKNYTLLETSRGRRVLERGLERGAVMRDAHPGAVYYHQGQSYIITGIDHRKREVYAIQNNADYYTRALRNSDVEVLEVHEERALRDTQLSLCSVRITERVTGYQRIGYDGEVKGNGVLSMPPTTLETRAVMLDVPQEIEDVVRGSGLSFEGGLHAAEHLLIAMFPIRLMVDRNDVGGFSEANGGRIYVYDGYPGGVGFAEKAYGMMEGVVEAALDAVRACSCESGCPSCVQSPKCGNGNEMLDKAAAKKILFELAAVDVAKPQEVEQAN